MKEATVRIKINKLLEAAGWHFFANDTGPANIQLEPRVTLTRQTLDTLGENFETSARGFVDFLLLNEKGFPLIVLKAKAEDKNPLSGKEQALVVANRGLITHMEKKIQAVLNRVCGEDAPVASS